LDGFVFTREKTCHFWREKKYHFWREKTPAFLPRKILALLARINLSFFGANKFAAFGAKVPALYAKINIIRRAVLQGSISRVLQHFATKLCNFTNFKILCRAVVIDFVLLV
jgi:hypothetical protein